MLLIKLLLVTTKSWDPLHFWEGEPISYVVRIYEKALHLQSVGSL